MMLMSQVFTILYNLIHTLERQVWIDNQSACVTSWLTPTASAALDSRNGRNNERPPLIPLRLRQYVLAIGSIGVNLWLSSEFQMHFICFHTRASLLSFELSSTGVRLLDSQLAS